MGTEEKAPRIDAKRNREAVIDAALHLLAEQPNASMATIAESSGVGRTTVYRHFQHREDLIRALFERIIEEARQATTEVIDRDVPDRQVLHDLGPAIAGIGRRFLFLQGALHVGEEVISESTLDPDDPVRNFLARAQASGSVRADMPLQWMLTVIRTLATGAMAELGAGRVDAAEAGRLLGDAFVRCFSN